MIASIGIIAAIVFKLVPVFLLSYLIAAKGCGIINNKIRDNTLEQERTCQI